jgi:hypothetical protein
MPTPLFAQATATGRNFCAAAPATTPRRISSAEDLVRRERPALEVLAEQLVVGLGRGLHERGAKPLRLVLELGRHVRLGVPREDLRVREVRLHRDEVDEPLRLAAAADRELERDGLHLERRLDVRDRLAEVAQLVVEPGDHAHPGAPGVGEHVVGALCPVVRAVGGRDGEERPIRHLERPLDLGQERREPRAVEHVERAPPLLEALGVEGQREVALLLLRLGVEAGGRALGRRPLGVGDAEQRLDEGSLAGAVGAQDRERADHARIGHGVVVSESVRSP